MKTKIMISSLLAAACLFVFSGATWADSRKDRRRRPPVKEKHVTVVKHRAPGAQQRHWKKGHRHHHKKYRYHKHHRAGYHGHKVRHRNYRYKPYDRYRHKHRHNYRPRHYSHRPAKKHHAYRYHRPIYRHTDGNVAIVAKTSHRGWSIKISAKD